MSSIKDVDVSILKDFLEESNKILAEIDKIATKLEDEHQEFPSQLFNDYAQRIDRIMGAAQTIEMMAPGEPNLLRIAKFAQLCKFTGYKIAEKKDMSSLPVCAAFFADVLELLKALFENIQDTEKSGKIFNEMGKTLMGRLEWLSKTFGIQSKLETK